MIPTRSRTHTAGTVDLANVLSTHAHALFDNPLVGHDYGLPSEEADL